MFWVFLGPVLVLLTFATAVAVGSFIAPLCALFALPMLWQWRWRAVLPAVFLMYLSVFLFSQHQESEFIVATAFAATFGLLVFSYEQFYLLNSSDDKDLLIVRLQQKIDAVKKINKDLDGENYLGKYKQLREQFQQKTNLLDATRQELFQANEEISRLQRLLEDKEEELLNDLHQALGSHVDEDHRSLEEEVIELRQLVTSLISSMESKFHTHPV